MQVNIVTPVFILDSCKNENIRKNDIKRLKLLVDKNNNLLTIKYLEGNMKDNVRNNIKDIINSNTFHLEQVYTLEKEKGIDILYVAVTNIENIKKLDDNYKLVDFKIEANKLIILDDNKYTYKTKEVIKNNNVEYIHEVKTDDEEIENKLLEILICYKKIRSNIDNTDILFKFQGKTFTLEDLRMTYELIKDIEVDKSNFRKKVVKYCRKIEDKKEDKNGFRPSSKYEFIPLKGDIWL